MYIVIYLFLIYKLPLKTCQIKATNTNLVKYSAIPNLNVMVGGRGDFHKGLRGCIGRGYSGQCFPFITLKSYLEGSDTLSNSRSNSMSIPPVPLEAKSASKA